LLQIFSVNPRCLALALVLLLPRWASAADPQELARRHFSRALELVDEQAYDEALAEFRRAYELQPHFSVLYNIGQAYQALGRPLQALEALEQYLADGGGNIPAPRRKRVESDCARIRARTAEISVDSTPRGATVTLDGKPVGTTPFAKPLRISIGTHHVTVTLEGYLPAAQQVLLGGEERQTFQFALRQPVVSAVGQLVGTCDVPEVALAVDGDAVLNWVSRPLVLTAKEHALVFSRPGYETVRKTVVVPVQKPLHVPCELRPELPLLSTVAGQLVVDMGEPGLSLQLDGAPFPDQGRIPFGQHRLEARKDGFELWSRDVRVETGQTTRVRVDPIPTLRHFHAFEDRILTRRTVGYALGLGGVLLAAVGGVVLGVSSGRREEWRDNQSALDRLWASQATTSADLVNLQANNDARLSSIRQGEWIGVGLMAAGGAALITGIVVLLTGENAGRYDRVIGSGSTLVWERSF
jgi:hypothetical protein